MIALALAYVAAVVIVGPPLALWLGAVCAMGARHLPEGGTLPLDNPPRKW